MSASDARPADFLARLAARALGLGDPVEPRLPSVFEGPAGGAVFPPPDPAPPGPAQGAEPAGGADVRSPAEQRAESGKRDGDADRPHPVDAGAGRDVFAGHAAMLPVPARGPDAAQAALPAPAGRPVAPLLPAAPAGTPVDGAHHGHAETVPAPAAQAGAGTAAGDRSQATGVLQAEGTTRHRAAYAGAEGQAARPLSARPVHGALVALKLPVRAASVVPAGPGRSGTPTRPAPEPVVHVSIGRVEVRASQSIPARAAAQGVGPGPLSLDEYLKQQERQR